MEYIYRFSIYSADGNLTYIEFRDICDTKAESMYTNQLHERFLQAIKKTRKYWNNDKEFLKIVKKMEKNKNLKRKEFAKVNAVLWEACSTY